MNQYQSTSSGAGLLKNDYQESDSDVTKALKKRREQLADKVWTPDKEDLESGKRRDSNA